MGGQYPRGTDPQGYQSYCGAQPNAKSVTTPVRASAYLRRLVVFVRDTIITQIEKSLERSLYGNRQILKGKAEIPKENWQIRSRLSALLPEGDSL